MLVSYRMSIFNLSFIWFLILLHLTQLLSINNRPNIIVILTDDQVTISKLELKIMMVCEDFSITIYLVGAFSVIVKSSRTFVWSSFSTNNKTDKCVTVEDVFLDAMTPMEKTNKLLAQAGTTFNNAFVNTPICCPSRCRLDLDSDSDIVTMWWDDHPAQSHLPDRPVLAQHGDIQQQHLRAVRRPGVGQQGDGGGVRAQAAGGGVPGGRGLGPELSSNSPVQTMYAGKYMNMYGWPGAGGVQQVSHLQSFELCSLSTMQWMHKLKENSTITITGKKTQIFVILIIYHNSPSVT